MPAMKTSSFKRYLFLVCFNKTAGDILISAAEKRIHKRVPYSDSMNFTVLSAQTANFSRIDSEGKIVDASQGGIGILTDFPLEPGHILEWRDRHQRGKLHIAIVKWTRPLDNFFRAGLMFI
jgi:hypothetical protein